MGGKKGEDGCTVNGGEEIREPMNDLAGRLGCAQSIC